jgi:2-C-methyl-D-erythritol 2,4-cyclodiphosphate synthase
LAGHSDGDVVLHALTDALLGAAHLGDIGTLFPSTDQRWRGANSGELLRIALDRAKAAGWRPTSADVVVVAPRPHIGEARPRMEERMASLLGIDREMVSVKGTTSDGLGITADEAIAAYAIIVVEWRS